MKKTANYDLWKIDRCDAFVADLSIVAGCFLAVAQAIGL